MSANTVELAEVKEKILNIVKKHVGPTKSEKVDENSLFSDVGLDSLDAVEIIMTVEEEFDVVISEEKATKLKTVADLVKCVEETLDPTKATTQSSEEDPSKAK
jgi:acyl carrier protein